jgi:hypothetical protein
MKNKEKYIATKQKTDIRKNKKVTSNLYLVLICKQAILLESEDYPKERMKKINKKPKKNNHSELM